MKLGPRQTSILECLYTRQRLGMVSYSYHFNPRVLASLVRRGLVATKGIGPSRDLVILVTLTTAGEVAVGGLTTAAHSGTLFP